MDNVVQKFLQNMKTRVADELLKNMVVEVNAKLSKQLQQLIDSGIVSQEDAKYFADSEGITIKPKPVKRSSAVDTSCGSSRTSSRCACSSN